MCERAKKTALVRPVVDEDEEGEAFVAESRFFSGFLTWIMVRGFGGRGRLPSNSARAAIRQKREDVFICVKCKARYSAYLVFADIRSFLEDTLNYTGRPDRGSKSSPDNCSKWPVCCNSTSHPPARAVGS